MFSGCWSCCWGCVFLSNACCWIWLAGGKGGPFPLVAGKRLPPLEIFITLFPEDFLKLRLLFPGNKVNDEGTELFVDCWFNSELGW